MSMILCLALLAVPLSLSSASAATTTVSLGASADTYLSTDSPDRNFGSAKSLTISHDSERVLLRFNLTFPTGATIQSATLRTLLRGSGQGTFRRPRLHRQLGGRVGDVWDTASL
jgi:hypothetical protein